MVDLEMEGTRDVVSVDPELLQLEEISPVLLKGNVDIVDQLYSQWLSLPETAQLAKSIVDDAKSGLSLSFPGGSSSPNAAAGNSLPSMFPAGSAPPLSPRSTCGSPRFMKHGVGSGLSTFGSPLKIVGELVKEVIPQFYFQNGSPPLRDLKKQCLSRIDQFFSRHSRGAQNQEFQSITKEICGLPSFFSTALFRKMDMDCMGIITRDAFVDFWVNSNMITMDTASRIFNVLKQPDSNFLTQEDFKPVLRQLLASHPGLEFLQSTPEFQERYGYSTT